MVNFNIQEGYSVVTILKTFPSDINPKRVATPSIDNLKLNHHSHNEHNELPIASSVLLVQKVEYKHAGNFTCSPSKIRAVSVTVHVLKGK